MSYLYVHCLKSRVEKAITKIAFHFINVAKGSATLSKVEGKMNRFNFLRQQFEFGYGVWPQNTKGFPIPISLFLRFPNVTKTLFSQL